MVVSDGVMDLPKLFRMEYDDGAGYITDRVLPGLEWVLEGKGEATELVDGETCAFRGGRFFKLKDGDWVEISTRLALDKWFVHAWFNTPWIGDTALGCEGMYEAVGKHFKGNPYGLDEDFLERHGRIRIKDCPRTFDGIMAWFRQHEVKGIVFWLDGEPKCKAERVDFGYDWPVRWEK